MIAVLTFFIVIVISLLINRIATKALVHSGLSRQSAQFQARSAFTGAGFTTSESEDIVNHPLRRKIVQILMLLGNAGLVSAISSLVLTFAGGKDQLTNWQNAGIILGGLLVIWLLSKSRYLDMLLERIIDKALKKYTDLNIKDYSRLLDLSGKYEVTELVVQDEDWIASKTLADCSLKDEGIIVLSIKRKNGKFLGVPDGKTRIEPGDNLILYGRRSSLKELDYREKGYSGDQAHGKASEEQKKEKEKEDQEDKTN
jgi:NhaP-type Na+/H+ and K+/H+ antiporter